MHDRPRPFACQAAAVIGGLALILAGVPMLVLPGPGVLSILFGLSILAGQFRWARRLLTGVTLWLRQKLAALPALEATA